MKGDMESKHYKPDKKLYFLLLAGSVAFIIASFFIPVNSRGFTIVAGFGCSGIASVIVAWLIDYANCMQKEKTNEELLDYMFAQFDAEVHNVLKLLLESYAKRNEEVDIEQPYKAHELYDLINNADVKLGIWDWYYKKLGDVFSDFEATPLLYDPIPQHNKLYAEIHITQDNYKGYRDMSKRLDKESLNSLSHFFLCDAIGHVEEIDNLRNKKQEYVVRDEQRDLIRKLRT